MEPNQILTHLINADTAALQKHWRIEFKTTPPYQASRKYLLGHLAWHAQAKIHGGLDKQTAKRLDRLISELEIAKELAVKETELIIKPGTKLLRAYQGVKHEVIVVENGYRYQSKIYKSLSSIAREITGTRWNGKLFFGVKK